VYREAFDQELPVVTLKRGVDFDQVVFGISIGSLPVLCPQLLAQSPALLATSEKVQTVATQAYQVWLDKDLAQMGWTYSRRPAAGAERLHRTLRHLGADGPAAGARRLAGAAGPAQRLLLLQRIAGGELSAGQRPWLPGAHGGSGQGWRHQPAEQADRFAVVGGRSAGAFPWQWLVDGSEATGVQRFDAQYWRANVDPSERYVMSVVNSTSTACAPTSRDSPTCS
jgi:hypothetical protein